MLLEEKTFFLTAAGSSGTFSSNILDILRNQNKNKFNEKKDDEFFFQIITEIPQLISHGMDNV